MAKVKSDSKKTDQKKVDPAASIPSTAIVQAQNKMLSYEEVEKLGKAFVASGMFGRDIDRISKAITKIMAGQELGIAPFAAMRAIHVIEGNATLSANVMAAMVKRSNQYDYVVTKKSSEACEVEFYEIRDGKRIKMGVETFDIEEAKTAGLLNKNNWRNYPKSMMFARCLSNGVRTYCPDVFNGMVVYTPDELGGQVTEAGNYSGRKDVIDGEIVEPGTDPQPPDEVDQTPPVDDVNQEVPEDPPLSDELKAKVQDNFDSIGLNQTGRMWFMKEITGKSFAKFDQLNDTQWHEAGQMVQDILDGKIQVEERYTADTVPKDGAQKVVEMFPGAEPLEVVDNKAVPANG